MNKQIYDFLDFVEDIEYILFNFFSKSQGAESRVSCPISTDVSNPEYFYFFLVNGESLLDISFSLDSFSETNYIKGKIFDEEFSDLEEQEVSDVIRKKINALKVKQSLDYEAVGIDARGNSKTFLIKNEDAKNAFNVLRQQGYYLTKLEQKIE